MRILIVLTSLVSVLAAGCFFSFHVLSKQLLTFEQVKARYPLSSFVDRRGTPLLQDEQFGKTRTRGWASLKEFKTPIDVNASAEALVSLLYPNRSQRLMVRAIQSRWSNEQILEAYLNLVEYRSSVQGISAASFEYFEKSVGDLNSKDILTLQSLIKNPVGRRSALRHHKKRQMPQAFRQNVDLNQKATLTFDLPLQNYVQHFVKKNESFVLIDNRTGEILSAINDVTSRSSLHEMFAPFLFATALDKRAITLKTNLHDAPLGPEYRENLSAREALQTHHFSATTEVLELIGEDQFLDTLQNLNLKDKVSLVDVGNAFRTFVHAGELSGLKWQMDSKVIKRSVFSEEASFLILDALTRYFDRQWYATYKGIDTQVLMSQQYTMVSRGLNEKYLLKIAQGLHQYLKSPAPQMPKNVVRLKNEFFISTTENMPKSIAAEKIIYPTDRSELAFDPKPLFFQVRSPEINSYWFLNGKALSPVRQFTAWKPREGHFHLEIRNSKGHTIDAVRFRVAKGVVPIHDL